MIVVRVTPAADMRRAFAEWAVEQRPKVRTVSSRSFAVPPRLFTGLPEYLLIGAMVDGHQYVPVPPDEQPEAEQGAVLPERECSAKCAGHLPLLPDGVYPADAIPLELVDADEAEPPHPPPAEETPDEGADEDPAQDTEPDSPAGHPCPDPLCGRNFDTARGLASHARTHAKAGD
ncbi:hypothetical protein ACFY0G_02280 [Streptomyces sp. NPDC001552]|uniref:hypothetical protein n=1 Tax=Streptomyces sp. NPDC001552 TaxID=3364587 RepID=UPI0036ADA9B4